MKRVMLAALVVLCSAAFAHASINLVSLTTGDTIQFLQQTDNAHYANGGSFDWQVVAAVNEPADTPFTTFCGQLGSYIYYGDKYTISKLDPVSHTSGIQLLDLWMTGVIPTSTDNAGAVQMQLWTDEGYTTAAITGDTGIGADDQARLLTLAGNLLLTYGEPSPIPNPYDYLAELTAVGGNQSPGTPSQNQYVYLVENPQTTLAIPEPATILIWSLLGAGSWLGMRVWGQRRRPVGRQPWSPEARQAIYDIVGRR